MSSADKQTESTEPQGHKYPTIDLMSHAHVNDMIETTDGTDDGVVGAAMCTLMFACLSMAEGDVEEAISLLERNFMRVRNMMDHPGFGRVPQ